MDLTIAFSASSMSRNLLQAVLMVVGGVEVVVFAKIENWDQKGDTKPIIITSPILEL